MFCNNLGINAELDRRRMHVDTVRIASSFKGNQLLVLKFIENNAVVATKSVVLRN